MNDVFSVFLAELGVKHTGYSHVFYSQHPYKDSLYGISDALMKYNIPNVSVRIGVDELKKIEPPFIVYLENDFIIVKEILPNDIKYIWNGKKFIISFQEFLQIWSGILLIAEPSNESKEPNYRKHLVYSLIQLLKKATFVILVILSILFTVKAPNQLGAWSLISLNFLGGYVGCLLFLKQNNKNSKIADRICTILKQQDCNNILDSKAAKFFSFSWSEIGLCYFLGNLIILFYFPEFIFFTMCLNIISLPYTFWSIWYQYKIIHQWCVLCLIVQVLLWGIFVVNVLQKDVNMRNITIPLLLCSVCIYGVLLLTINKLSDWVVYKQSYRNLLQKYNKIKINDDVFRALLYKQPRIKVSKLASQIIFGNIDSQICITAFTNPHCNPCAQMHFRLKKIICELEHKVCVQYVFSAFNEDLLDSNRILIAAYLQNNRDAASCILDMWFRWGKTNPLKFCHKYGLLIKDSNVDEELDKHEKWKQKNELKETPMIFLNGYLLPKEYSAEDLILLVNNIILSDNGVI
ncbi:vitamin K epoxide reductase family protein [uncultured Bacteroides sp.]|uniref:vitamin K epoxide reductase family protein n=1 Tax=uncultured Bacteroides sp. TaxID=162156 RepID=UPI002AA6E6F0|nr:vitamin K epoxide reductase family protein [uncultured Bacteroides sp.]